MEVECYYYGCSTTFEVPDDGSVNEDAIRVFTNGQCHSLAMVLHEMTSWPLVGLFTKHDRETPSHVAVLTPKGIFDIEGLGVEGRWERHWKSFKTVTVAKADVEGYPKIDYLPLNKEAAKPFAQTLLSEYGIEPLSK